MVTKRRLLAWNKTSYVTVPATINSAVSSIAIQLLLLLSISDINLAELRFQALRIIDIILSRALQACYRHAGADLNYTVGRGAKAYQPTKNGQLENEQVANGWKMETTVICQINKSLNRGGEVTDLQATKNWHNK